MDSTIAMYWAINAGINITHALSFNYNQRHIVELAAAERIAKIAGVTHKVLNVFSLSALSDSALVKTREECCVDLSAPHFSNENVPATFVPGRNLIFLTLAAAFAFKHSAEQIVTGVCQTDYSGYPDCRQNTIDALQVAVNLGMETNIIIHAPLMWLTKAESILSIENLDVDLQRKCWKSLSRSHTCYEGEYPPCGDCPACKLRGSGFAETGFQDPLMRRYQEELMELDLNG